MRHVRQIITAAALVLALLGVAAGPRAAVAQDAPAKTELDATRFVRAADPGSSSDRSSTLATAVMMQRSCANPFEPCSCTFEGFQAPCSFVLACLANGLCVPAAPTTTGLLRQAAGGGRLVLTIEPNADRTIATCDGDDLSACDTLAAACQELGGTGQCGGDENPTGCQCEY